MNDPWSNARRVLAVRLDCMGDVLMTGPALKSLKEGAEGRDVTLLTSPSGATAGELMPYVDDVITARIPWMKGGADPLELHSLVRTLTNRYFDAAVIFTVYSQSALPAATMCYLCGIPLLLAHCRENPYHLLTHWVPDPEPFRMVRHEVERQLALVSEAGCNPDPKPISIQIPQAAHATIHEFLEGHPEIGAAGDWLVIHPGASATSRMYPAERFAEVARELFSSHGCMAIYTGSEAEAPLVEKIRALSGTPSLSLAGKLSVPEMAALIDRAPLLLGNNTGPAHLAAATSTPVVVLYALTNPQHAPWMTPSRVLFHDVPCRYCYKSVCPEGHHHCLTLIEPGEIVEAVMELLASSKRLSSSLTGTPVLPACVPSPSLSPLPA